MERMYVGWVMGVCRSRLKSRFRPTCYAENDRLCNLTWGPPLGALFAGRTSPCSPFQTLPVAASAVPAALKVERPDIGFFVLIIPVVYPSQTATYHSARYPKLVVTHCRTILFMCCILSIFVEASPAGLASLIYLYVPHFLNVLVSSFWWLDADFTFLWFSSRIIRKKRGDWTEKICGLWWRGIGSLERGNEQEEGHRVDDGFRWLNWEDGGSEGLS